MKISYNWLRQYIKTELSPEKLAELLTGCGLEVESIEEFHSVKGGLKGVVIGEVLSCTKHPDSDHLSLTTVDIGQANPLKIVCGAPNVAAGQKVAVAGPGTTLYFNEKELTLQKTKIRGEVSEGMICAEDELGLGKDHAGIMVLSPEAKTGRPASEYFGIEHDWVLTIGLTPNRADAASHIGVARDLAAVINNFGRSEPLEKSRLQIQLPDVSAFKQDNDNHVIGITIEDPMACKRYTGLTLTGIKVAESPSWLKNRLNAIGVRPINNIVDVTNFILMELGQPLHAFDTDRITGKDVIVRKYPSGTKFTTLDDVERELGADDLMICSKTEPMCIAGVFGGLNSGVTSDTTSVFLESAYFDPVHIRRTARYHGLSTDASFRFERGADYNITVYAIQRAALLIKEVAGGEISSPVIDVYPKPIGPATVFLSWVNLDRLIGKTLNRQVVRDILTDIGMQVTGNPQSGTEGLEITVPSYKVDVTRDVDVIEEILRIYGYNNVEILPEVRSSMSFTRRPDPDKVRNVVSDYLSANGFNEIMNNSLTRSVYYGLTEDFPIQQCVKILNPISRDLDVMRQNLLYGCLESMIYNLNRKSADLKFYEFGTVYLKASGQDDPVKGYHEESHLSMAITGRSAAENWNSGSGSVNWFDLSGYIQAVFSKLGIGDKAGIPGRRIIRKKYSGTVFSNGQIFSVNDKVIGMSGLLSRNILKQFDIKQDVYYGEFDWSSILSMVPVKETQYRELPRFPEVRRDLALLLDETVKFEEIENLAYQTEKKLLKHVGLFDVYEGEKLGKGKKSYAVSFTLRDEEKTLTDKEIDKCMDRLIIAFSNNFKAQVR
ncbi:MAG: phenylalanine--tRNA ligase subunit beta [Bacteroidetes bacterium]|nr:phenylalanine--tRNA ligase subunit beta [Bacteroidota bacterium]